MGKEFRDTLNNSVPENLNYELQDEWTLTRRNAAYALANLYVSNGFRRYSCGLNLYKKLIALGHIDAQYMLGLMYDKGHGVAQSDSEALKWYFKAADQGCIDAQYILGLRYDQGHGVPQSEDEAVRWYRKAADHRHAQAISKLKEYNEKHPPQIPSMYRAN
jgi:TPR repeat protein